MPENIAEDVNEPSPLEIRAALNPIYRDFNLELEKFGLRDVEIVSFLTARSEDIIREGIEESSDTIFDRLNRILKKHGFVSIEVVDFTTARKTLIRKSALSSLSEVSNEASQNVLNLLIRGGQVCNPPCRPGWYCVGNRCKSKKRTPLDIYSLVEES